MAPTRTDETQPMTTPPGDDPRTGAGAPDGGLDGAGLQVLDRSECLELLARGGVGRIAINAGARPMILPVRCALDDDSVVLCVGVGSTLDQTTRHAVVAFEVDGSDLGGEGSVSVVGIAGPVPDGDESARAETLPLPRWWLGRPHRFVSIATEHVAGRRVPVWP
jgi:uncharacterized protein